MNIETINVEKPVKNSAMKVKIPMRVDPVLDELWRIKAELNAAAGYNVQVLLERAAAYQGNKQHNPV